MAGQVQMVYFDPPYGIAYGSNFQPARIVNIRSLLFVVPGLFIAATTLATANGQCPPDCEGDVWGPDQTTTVYLSCAEGGNLKCAVTVTYRTRMSCSTYYDFHVVSAYRDDSPQCMTQCFGSGVPISWVVAEMIRANPMGFSPLPGQPCTQNWRAFASACYYQGELITPVGPRFGVTSCPEVGCCFTRYQVCIDANGKRTFLPLTAPPPEYVCVQSGCDSYCFDTWVEDVSIFFGEGPSSTIGSVDFAR